MAEQFLSSVRRFNTQYGELATWIWRLVFYPVLLLTAYAGTSYLNSHYVSKEYFDKAMATLSEEKQRFALDQKQDLQAISGKLDVLLESRAVNTQRINDTERRIARLEAKEDKER